MGSLTVVEAFGQTLEQALEAALADQRATIRREGAPELERPGCLVCGGQTVTMPIAGGRTLVSCRDCHSSIETASPGQASLRLAS